MTTIKCLKKLWQTPSHNRKPFQIQEEKLEPLQVTDNTVHHNGNQLPRELTNHSKNALANVILGEMLKEYTDLLITSVRPE